MRGAAALIGGMFLLASPGAAGDGLSERFAGSCAARERTELLRSEVGPWMIELCEREAHERAAAYRSAGDEERRAMLTTECADWYVRNAWRLPPAFQDDDAGRRGFVAAACAAEAEERRRELDRLR